MGIGMGFQRYICYFFVLALGILVFILDVEEGLVYGLIDFIVLLVFYC